jgi:hypothetical protein
MMKKSALKVIGLFGLALTLILSMPHRAAADDDDPPGRVARLGYVRGVVSFEPAGTDDWVSAEINRPITTGDKIWTDRDSRAELHLGAATIRLSSETGFSFLDLSDRITQLRLTEGTMNVRVRRLGGDETFEVDTPNLAFSILRPGQYRISVNQDGEATMITVRDGEGEITGGGSAYTLYADESGTFRGTDQLDADIEGIAGEDDFDRWSYERDRRIDHSVSSRYVSDDAVGYEDLDDYGGWRPVPEYGTVWFPHVTTVDWAPYRYGHWCWIAPWGWTWVDDAPWGFAPFHYGRWITVGGVWGWVPCAPRPVEYGGEYIRPVYAPALVAWVGGSHFAVGIGFGGGVSVGWFPLGPREVYVPSYPVSRRYVNNVNITNTTVNTTVVNNYYNNTVVNHNVNVTNVKYVNQTAPNAVTATSGAAFSSAKPVGRNMIQVNQKEIAAAPVAATAPAGAPPKQAVLGAGAAATAKPPANVQDRPVVAKNTPPPPPASFEKQAAAIQQNGGKPLAISQARQLQPARTQAAAVPVQIAPPAKPAAPRVDNSPSAGARQSQAMQNSPNKSASPNVAQSAQGNPNKPAAPIPGQAPQTNATQPPQGNAPGNTPAGQNPRVFNDRPPSSPPARSMTPDPRMEEKHQQELQQLQQKQDQERQLVEQQQRQKQQELQQKNASEQKQRQLQQELQRQQQQKLQDLENKHAQEQRNLQQKQEQEHQQQQPKPEPKPKQDSNRKDDRPPNR